MSAYMLAFVSLTSGDLDWVADYQAKVPEIARQFGGQYVGISKAGATGVECVEGSAEPPDAIIIVHFPTMAKLKAFLVSGEYAPHRDARIATTDSHIFAFANDADAPQFKR